MGKLTLNDYFVNNPQTTVLIFGIVLIVIAIAIPKVELFDEADLCKLPDEQRPDKK